jgi:hypothetical protein
MSERALLDSKVEELKNRLAEVRGLRFRRSTWSDEDAGKVHCDSEGAAVFQIAVELNRIWSRIEALDAAQAVATLPQAPKPSTRPPQREPKPAPVEDDLTFIRRLRSTRLETLSRRELRSARDSADTREWVASLTPEGRTLERCLTLLIRDIDKELRRAPFDILDGEELGDGVPRARLELIPGD